MHIAIIGTGRVGRYTLFALLSEGWISRLTLIDTKTGLADAVEQEARHALASIRNPMEIESYERDEAVENADLVLITAGTPRTKDMASRTDLTESNAEIVKEIAEKVVPENPGAKYVVVTNPVDAMATLFKDISSADWVISTGTNLESQRFRAELAKELDLPLTQIRGFAGGEHGKRAVFLWSTVRISGLPLDAYLKETEKELDKERVEEAVKEISREIIKYSGGTRHGPATSFRDILRGVAVDDNRVLSVATPYGSKELPKEVMVSRPQLVGQSVGPGMEGEFSGEEKEGLNLAAKRIYETYREVV